MKLKPATTLYRVQAGIKKIAPGVNIRTIWTEDPHFRWDGDGPDPVEEGYVAHNVSVIAEVELDDGTIVVGDDHLGGSYEKPGVEDPLVHGYYYDMLSDALRELYEQLTGKKFAVSRKDWDPMEPPASDGSIPRQVGDAITFLEASAKAIYLLEQRRRRR